MKKILFTLCAAAVLCSCNSNGYTLTGKLSEPCDSVYLLSSGSTHEVVASAAVDAEGNFTLKGRVTEPAILLFAVSGPEPVAYFFPEAGKITMNEEYLFSGTPANDAFAQSSKALAGLQSRYDAAQSPVEVEQIMEEVDSMVRAAIRQNSNNMYGVYTFAQNFYKWEDAEIREALELFTPEMRQTEPVQSVEQLLASKANTEIGKPYMELKLMNTQGEEVAISSLVGEGKWVLIDFWATWCGPCKAEIPHLVEAYKAYHDKGFEIYGVSLDHNTEAWKAYVAGNEMNWVNVLGRGDEATNAQVDQYAVQTIPSNFLISPDGVIYASQLRGEAVMETLAEVLK